MSKTTRLFEIIQILRTAKAPLPGAEIARMLEVSTRTVYRDIADLQAMRTPIVGEPGIGYVLRRGYDLPPVNFDTEEAEAVSVGLSLIARTGDKALWKAARSAARKLHDAAPESGYLIASNWGIDQPEHADMALVRAAIRDERKLAVDYRDADGRVTRRTLRPLALIYYVDNAMLIAWCEMRADFRHFRLDRMQSCTEMEDFFTGDGPRLRADWEKALKAQTVDTAS